jgi:hypothetical protein
MADKETIQQLDSKTLLRNGREEAFEAPEDPNIRIWRYMDFIRLVNMLEEEALFFRRSDLFEDKFEGTMSQPLRDYLQKREVSISLEQYGDVLHRVRSCSFVNSWHMNEAESAAMWRVFSSSHQSICIQSTYARLRRVLPKDVDIGYVKYILYERDQIPFGNAWWPLLHKRKAFEYERELRAVWTDTNSLECSNRPERDGVWKRVDLQELIESIYVSPGGEHWFVKLVKKILKRYGKDVEVRQSDLASEPLYY